jgi:hypothetical protein
VLAGAGTVCETAAHATGTTKLTCSLSCTLAGAYARGT